MEVTREFKTMVLQCRIAELEEDIAEVKEAIASCNDVKLLDALFEQRKLLSRILFDFKIRLIFIK